MNEDTHIVMRRYGEPRVILYIQCKCRKTDQKNFEFRHFA